MRFENLRPLGWKPCFQQQLPVELPEGHVVTRVSAHLGSQVALVGEAGETRTPVQLTESVGDLAVGDWLVVDDDGRAVQRLERQTLIYRKAAGLEAKPQLIAANVDTIFVVCSCNEDFNLSRIERYLALILEAEAEPVVLLTKADLAESPHELRRQVERLHRGLMVEALDGRDPGQVEALDAWCRPGQSVALVGSSGVGKSTLANTLGVGGLATGAIREKDGKGRHVTTTRSLHVLPGGGVLVDTPGMRELQLPACEEGLADLFEDVYAMAERCRFRDCRHEGEPGCAVLSAVESGELDQRRYHSFKKLLAEQAHNARTLLERRDQDRKRGRFYKSVIGEKQRRRDAL